VEVRHICRPLLLVGFEARGTKAWRVAGHPLAYRAGREREIEQHPCRELADGLPNGSDARGFRRPPCAVVHRLGCDRRGDAKGHDGGLRKSCNAWSTATARSIPSAQAE